jgi:hypothetical protein
MVLTGCGSDPTSERTVAAFNATTTSTTTVDTTTSAPSALVQPRGRNYSVHVETTDGYVLDGSLTVGSPLPLAASDLPPSLRESNDPYCVGASSRALVVKVGVRMTMTRGLTDDMTILFSRFANSRDFAADFSTGAKCKSPGNSEMETSVVWHQIGPGGSGTANVWFIYPDVLTPNSPTGDLRRIVGGDNWVAVALTSGTGVLGADAPNYAGCRTIQLVDNGRGPSSIDRDCPPAGP